VSNGQQPACAKACPTGAIEFGDRDALIAKAHNRVAVLQGRGFVDANLYGEHLLGGLHQMYVLTDKPSLFELPEAPRVATRNVLGSWLSGILTAGVVAAVPFWLLFKRKQELAAQKVSEGGES
jgi:formate dehydrogenase iron-sulfur subunit